MDPLFSYTNVHNTSFLFSFFLFRKNRHQCDRIAPAAALVKKDIPLKTKKSIILAAITPAQTTTQLLLSHSTDNALQQQACLISSSQSKNLSTLLQNNYKIPVSSSGIGYLQPLVSKNEYKGDPPAAQQPKRPAWTETHAYLRGPSRTNSDHLRILTTELNMIRASKITRSLKPRKAYINQPRKDEFVWGNPSCLRINQSMNTN